MDATENSVNDKEKGSVNDKVDHLPEEAESSVNDKADHLPEEAKGSVIDKADHLPEEAKGSVIDKADHLPEEAKGSVIDKADHLPEEAKGSVIDKADHLPEEAKGSVIDKADHLQEEANVSGDDKADHLPEEAKGSVNDKADHLPEESKVSVNEKADHVPEEAKGSVIDKADHLPEEAKGSVNDKADHLPEEAMGLLKSLASKWDDVLDANALQVIPLKGAMTNKVFQIKWPTKTEEPSRKVVVRIYGEGVENFFDRDDEIRTSEFMSKHEQGPRLLGQFANGRIEEFIHARTLSASDLRDPSISALIAAKMKEFHGLDIPGPKKVCLWDRLRNWVIVAKGLSSAEEVESFYLDTIDKEIAIWEKELSGAQQCIGFCHNDLQYGNIMLNEETNSVTLIDYEYASYNPVAYDIANHFCEMAADYHTEAPHILDYSKYPDSEERERFVRAYLSSSGQQPSDSEVEQLLQEVEKYTLVNHLFWGVWGIISGHVNKIDFDYMEYAKQRFQEYWARKPYLLCSSGPSLNNIATDGNRT